MQMHTYFLCGTLRKGYKFIYKFVLISIQFITETYEVYVLIRDFKIRDTLETVKNLKSLINLQTYILNPVLIYTCKLLSDAWQFIYKIQKLLDSSSSIFNSQILI